MNFNTENGKKNKNLLTNQSKRVSKINKNKFFLKKKSKLNINFSEVQIIDP